MAMACDASVGHLIATFLIAKLQVSVTYLADPDTQIDTEFFVPVTVNACPIDPAALGV